MGDFVELLGSGREHGCQLTYRVQDEAGGIAQALGLAEHVLHAAAAASSSSATTSSATRSARCCDEADTAPGLGLGRPQAGARPRPLRRRRAEGRRRSSASRRSRSSPKSDFAVAGIYIYPPDVFDVIKTLKPSRPRRAGDHRRQQLLPEAGPAGLQRPRRLLDRRRHARLAGRRQRAGPRRAAAVEPPGGAGVLREPGKSPTRKQGRALPLLAHQGSKPHRSPNMNVSSGRHSRGAADHSGRVQGRPGLFLRGLPGAALCRPRHPRRHGAGQPLRLAARRAARPALSDPASAGKAGQRRSPARSSTSPWTCGAGAATFGALGRLSFVRGEPAATVGATGLRHGFLVLSSWAEVTYKVHEFYSPQDERTLLWNDPALNIDWPLADGQPPLLSGKDAKGLRLAEAERPTNKQVDGDRCWVCRERPPRRSRQGNAAEGVPYKPNGNAASWPLPSSPRRRGSAWKAGA